MKEVKEKKSEKNKENRDSYYLFEKWLLSLFFYDLLQHTEGRLEDLFASVLKMAGEYEKEYNAHIPVIPAGGIFDGKDMARFLKMGAEAVQIATRFVATFECSVSEKFKSMYLEAGSGDVIIIDSPVGMPARAIKNRFTDRLISGERVPFNCH